MLRALLQQGAIFVNYDTHMRDPVTGEYALARNTNLNEVRSSQRELLLCIDARANECFFLSALTAPPTAARRTWA